MYYVIVLCLAIAILIFVILRRTIIISPSSIRPTISGETDGFDYVDLGLPSGIKWATCNVGAEYSTESGDFFAWGEVKTKENYDWSTYRWCKNKKKDGEIPKDFTKYCTNSDYGKVDYQLVLQPPCDAATTRMGQSWHTPTLIEVSELMAYCSWEWTDDFSRSGVAGCIGTASNGNKIFFPAAGYHKEKHFFDNIMGCYWTSIIFSKCTPDHTEETYKAYNYFITKDLKGKKWYNSNDRCLGFMVRGVCK